MNYRTLVKGALALSLSLIVASASAATTTYNDVQEYGATFENTAVEKQNDFDYALGSGITNRAYRLPVAPSEPTYGWFSGDAESDESKIIERTDAAGGQALQLNTDASTLTNKFSSTVAGAINTALAANGTAYFETEVKFVPSDTPEAGINGNEDATKFAIYAYANEEADPPVTNLVVFHAVMNAGGAVTYTNEIFDVDIDATKYVNLRVEMKKLVDPEDSEASYNVFSVKIDDDDELTSDTALDALFNNTATGKWFLTIESDADDENHEVSSLNFKGTGEIDNIKAGTIAATTEYAIDWTDSDGVTITSNGNTLGAGDTNFLAGAEIVFTATGENVVITNITVDGTAQSITNDTVYSYFVGSADAKVTVLAGIQAVTPTTYAVSWAGSDKVVVSNATEQLEGTSGSFEAGVVLTFYPTEGSITNVNGETVADLASYPYTVQASDNQTVVVLAGQASQERVKPAWAADADTTKFWTWVDLYNVNYATDYTAQYLMNVDPSKTPVLKIDSIVVTADGSQIVISATDGTDAIDLANINGVLNVSVGSSVTALTSKAIPEANITVASNVATVIIKAADGSFAKATVDFTAAETSLTAVAAQ